MPFYECVFIARQDVSQQQVDALGDHFVKVIEEQGGGVPKREYWGLRSLAYRIRKNRKGHYVLFNIEAPPAAIEEVGRQMRINEDVIRHMTVRVDALVEGPSAALLSRSRDDRPRDRDRGDRGDRGDRDRGDRDRGPRRSFGDDAPPPRNADAAGGDGGRS